MRGEAGEGVFPLFLLSFIIITIIFTKHDS